LTKVEGFNKNTVLVQNYLGQTVAYFDNTALDLVEISTENLGTGFFTVSVVFEDGSRVVRKVLVVK